MISQRISLQITSTFIAMKEKPVELPTSTHYKQSFSVTEKSENLTTTGNKANTTQYTVHEKHVIQR